MPWTQLGLDTASIADPKPADWKLVAKAGYVFMIHRASFDSRIDPQFELEREGAIENGLVVGRYHIPNWMLPKAPQMEVLKRCPDLLPDEMMPVYDVEWGKVSRRQSGMSVAQVEDWISEAVEVLEARHGGTAGIYTSRQQWMSADLGPIARLARCWLWLASHEAGPAPEPPSWALGSLMIEQVVYNKSGVPGIQGLIDRDEFRPILRGERSARVKWLQERIGATTDGVFGPKTEAALLDWQGRQKLPVTGVVLIRDLARLTRQP